MSLVELNGCGLQKADATKTQAVQAGKKNKTSSAVQLRHIPTGIVVKSQETRSREQNRKIARLLLATKLEDIEKGEESRNNVLKNIAQKKKASKRKKSLRKYRKLDEAKLERDGQLAVGSSVAGELGAGDEDGRVIEYDGDEGDEESEEDEVHNDLIHRQDHEGAGAQSKSEAARDRSQPT
ncbi:hypothetical protein TWF694_007498 [Orbilia ellipsospora]|uniref:Prokaryotic-type class I peptide chain release factors domain-containing protein n=1 Tax=Orbilia ellipsospora TaxID=2528407 RepID=A0AAV9XHW3_9PEZI